MIVKETIVLDDGRMFIKTYSDSGYKIHKIGTDEFYGEALDIPESGYEYEETGEKNETEELLENKLFF